MKKIILSIDGMTCSACSNGLEKYLNKQDGIQEASVNLVMATASIIYEDKLNINDLNNFIQEAGFKSLGIANPFDDKKEDKGTFLITFGILALLAMYISMAPMINLPTISYLNMDKHPIIYSVVLLILTIPFVILGRDIIKSGINNLIHKMPNMDTLVSIGIITSFIYSLYGVLMIALGNIHYAHSLYFESCIFVVYFIKLGRFIEKNSHNKTKEAIKKLVTITPKKAKIKNSNGYQEVTIDEVKRGDILVCLAGDKVAVDGEIVKGNSHFDESFITGESKPVNKKKGNKVIAGSINYDGVIEYRAERIGKESTISEIINLVIEATNTKAPIAKLADKISSYFVCIILLLAFLTLAICLIIKVPFNESLLRFVTVLVVACPCALGLATPLAIVVAEGICATNGILVKSSETLELASKIDTVVFDKTGTLTNGCLTISKIYNYSNLIEDELLKIIGNIEKQSTHPIAKGIIKYINKRHIKLEDNFQYENIAGMGIKAYNDKKTYYACNSTLLKILKIKNNHVEDEKILTQSGNSVVYIVDNNQILALLGVKDTLRNETKKVIKKLQEMHKDVIMLTGDNKETANIIAHELGIKNIIANVLPIEKTNEITKLKNQGKKVIMIGDGINDALSLIHADIGISLSNGTEIASDSADVILINNNLEKIIDLLLISKQTFKVIKQNLFWAFLYNVCMIPIAMGLLKQFNIAINPMIACLTMIFSSLFVTINSLRLKLIMKKNEQRKR